MKSYLIGILLSAFAATALAADGGAPALIPLPQKVERHEGAFKLAPDTRIVVDKASKDTGKYLAQMLRKSTGYALKVSTQSKPAAGKKTAVLIVRDPSAGIAAEGYQLTVEPQAVVIRAGDSAGAFYGVQTLLQLLPPEVYASKPAAGVDWCAPCVRIEDQPRFKWRGLMLDVSRHFFTKDEVKQLLDAMAAHKLNTFHWHLADDNGWRIEIKKYPRLTEVGAWRHEASASTRPEGQHRLRPGRTLRRLLHPGGHPRGRRLCRRRGTSPSCRRSRCPGTRARRLSAYPELSCTGGPYTTEPRAGVFAGVYCAGNEATFEFLQNVLTEVMGLFPGKYIHIGGDEVPKDNWKKCPKCQARMKQEGLKTEHELQSYFIRRIEKFINSKGRTLIGWSEIREGGLAQNAVVMDWIGGAVEAASAGHDVVMSPTKFCYLDYYQSTNHATEPKAIGGYVPLSKVYSFEPMPAELDPQFQSHILGGQGNLWTEYVPNFKHAEFMAFPRLCALPR